jgi:hypothetical protein
MSTRRETAEAAPRFARLQVELVVQLTDRQAMVAAALDQVAGDAYMPDEERGRSVAAIREDETEALAFLVDPYDLVSGVPGVELAQASWSCGATAYDPKGGDAESWAFGEDEDGGADEGEEGGPEGTAEDSWSGGGWEGSGADRTDRLS